MTPEGRERAVRFFRVQKADPVQRWIKVIDTDKGAIVGMAQYAIWERGGKMPETRLEGAPSGNWATEEDAEYAQALWKSFMANQNAALSEKPQAVVCLFKFAVAPEYQGRGAGRMLLRWGVDLADRIGAEFVVEGAPKAVPLYHANGFRTIGESEFTVPEQFSARHPKYVLTMLHRWPQPA